MVIAANAPWSQRAACDPVARPRPRDVDDQSVPAVRDEPIAVSEVAAVERSQAIDDERGLGHGERGAQRSATKARRNSAASTAVCLERRPSETSWCYLAKLLASVF